MIDLVGAGDEVFGHGVARAGFEGNAVDYGYDLEGGDEVGLFLMMYAVDACKAARTNGFADNIVAEKGLSDFEVIKDGCFAKFSQFLHIAMHYSGKVH